MNRFIFRLEANNRVGMGHFYRCLSLARALSGHEIAFLVNEFDGALRDILAKVGIELKVLGTALPYEAGPKLSSHMDTGDVVVVDGYPFDERYRKTLKRLSGALVVIDDLNSGRYSADIIINHGPHARGAAYDLESKDTRLLLGSEYALLRPAFLENAGKGRLRDIVDTVTICFGGADSRNFSLKFLEALVSRGNRLSVNIVLGPANLNPAALYEDRRSEEVQVGIKRDLSDVEMAALLLGSDLVVCSPSGIAMEACALNVPMVVAVTHANQAPLAEFLYERELACVIRDAERKTGVELAGELLETLGDRALRELFAGNQKKYFDGQSGKRLRHELTRLMASVAGKAARR